MNLAAFDLKHCQFLFLFLEAFYIVKYGVIFFFWQNVEGHVSDVYIR